jgi:hypothetical protein
MQKNPRRWIVNQNGRISAPYEIDCHSAVLRSDRLGLLGKEAFASPREKAMALSVRPLAVAAETKAEMARWIGGDCPR